MPNIDPALLEALIQVESSGNPNAFNKGSGARGLTQITPIAWKDLVARHPQVYGKLKYERDVFKPEIARQAGLDYLNIIQGYLKHYKMPMTTENLLGSYNWGVGNVRDSGLGKAPKETRDYIKKINAILGSK